MVNDFYSGSGFLFLIIFPSTIQVGTNDMAFFLKYTEKEMHNFLIELKKLA